MSLKTAWIIGVLIQALVLGTLLFLALGKLMATESGARLFRYQAF